MPMPVLPIDYVAITVNTEEWLRGVVRGVNHRKTAGPDGITGTVLRDCADQLTEIFTTIFNISLHCPQML